MSKKLSVKELGARQSKKKFPEKIAHEILETNSSFHVK